MPHIKFLLFKDFMISFVSLYMAISVDVFVLKLNCFSNKMFY
jgi:hypothetical protein